MTKSLPFILLLLMNLAACNGSGTDAGTEAGTGIDCELAANRSSEECTNPEETVDPVEGETNGSSDGGSTESSAGGSNGGVTSDLPEAAFSWDADIYLVNFNAAQEAKVSQAVQLIKKVLATEEFRTRVLNYTYNGKKAFVDNEGYTNAQIYQKLLDGAETMNGNKNNIMDVELELYYSLTSTIGYTYPDTTRIWMNTKYFNDYTPVQVADNLTHEWLHKLGFGHASSYSVSRDHSVPYAIGYLMEELAAKYYK